MSSFWGTLLRFVAGVVAWIDRGIKDLTDRAHQPSSSPRITGASGTEANKQPSPAFRRKAIIGASSPSPLPLITRAMIKTNGTVGRRFRAKGVVAARIVKRPQA